MKRSSFKVTCPVCGNLLGVMEDGVLIVKKKGRVIEIKVWEEAEIECECCKNRMTVHRYRGTEKQWDGVIRSWNDWHDDGTTTTTKL